MNDDKRLGIYLAIGIGLTLGAVLRVLIFDNIAIGMGIGLTMGA